MARRMADQFKLRLRWAILDGLPRAALAAQARRGDPLARLLIGPQRGGDPYPLLEQIRAHGRLMRTPLAWATTDHELCRTILRDSRFVVTSTANLNLPAPATWLINYTDPQLPHPGEPPSILQVDPPEHSRYRRPVAHAFTPKAIEGLRTRITDVSAELLNRIESSTQSDLIADYAAPLPAAIIADILGIPEGHRSQMLERGDSGAPLLDIGVPWKTFDRGMRMLHASGEEINAQIDLLRAEPGDGIFSHIVEHGNLTRHELATTATLIAGAGFETTVNLIGNAIVLLLQHPDQLAMLRADPELWPNAVEEVLRHASPVQMTSRTTACDVELVGHRIPAHATVALLLSGANRDPEIFADPAGFDITRANANDHLSFSSGIHVCLGASLARMEAALGLRALFDRFPTIQLNGQPSLRNLATLNGFSHIPAAPRTAPDPTELTPTTAPVAALRDGRGICTNRICRVTSNLLCFRLMNQRDLRWWQGRLRGSRRAGTPGIGGGHRAH
jgi:cytochrome P450